jgi:hypothetical protein
MNGADAYASLFAFFFGQLHNTHGYGKLMHKSP